MVKRVAYFDTTDSQPGCMTDTLMVDWVVLVAVSRYLEIRWYDGACAVHGKKGGRGEGREGAHKTVLILVVV